MSMANEHQKDFIITFVKNIDPSSARFEGNEPVFSIPYSKIIEAARFCERERIDYVFLGFKNQTWQHEISSDSFDYFITVDQNGLSSETTREYAYVISQSPSF
jgi:hypothetical protein